MKPKLWNGPRLLLNKALVAIRHLKLGLPDTLGIEISTACNKRCSYCPQSVVNPKQQIITDELFDLFIDRMKEAKWHGLVGISSWAEPSLVPSSAKYVFDIRKNGAYPTVFTNGRSVEVIKEWISAGAARVIVTEHDPFDDDTRKGMQELVLKYPLIVKVKRVDTENLISKMGDWPVKIGGIPMTHCQFSNAIGYNVNGDAYLCCIDHACEHSPGNLKDMPILDLWYSEKYKKIRKSVQSGKPANDLCAKCLGVNKS